MYFFITLFSSHMIYVWMMELGMQVIFQQFYKDKHARIFTFSGVITHKFDTSCIINPSSDQVCPVRSRALRSWIFSTHSIRCHSSSPFHTPGECIMIFTGTRALKLRYNRIAIATGRCMQLVSILCRFRTVIKNENLRNLRGLAQETRQGRKRALSPPAEFIITNIIIIIMMRTSFGLSFAQVTAV